MTQPNLRGLDPSQILLARASWAIFLVPQDVTERDDWLFSLEMYMQPETLHRLALARGMYFRRQAEEKQP
jgi:hypothetical protein